ncbi:MAG TPA: TetR/AcrR family transcriptional regulator [Myxococcota bacterium]|nr:TetR/AcrR family transcriptional regulator [Myxococcota bacterium]
MRSPLRTNPGRVRPTSEERRSQILREAARCFGTRGFRGTTTRDVANAVGITEAALYRHFASKEAIYAAILDARTTVPSAIDAVEPFAKARDDLQVFTRLALAVLQSVESDPSFLRLLLYSALEDHEMARPFYETRMRRLRDFLSQYIEERAREGAFRALEPSLAARAFLGMVADHLISRTVFGQKDNSTYNPQRVAETFTSIFLDGIRAGAARDTGVTRG